jgi:uncharacterized protein
MSSAGALIERLGLQPHPEGGWYAETWRAAAADGARAASTAIHFLLEAGQASHWHRVDAAEVWLWHAGDPLILSLCETDAGPVEAVTLGGDVLAGQKVQQVIPPHWWQAARPASGPAGYVLVSCVVAPGFDFAGFELAAAGWNPGA